MKKNQTVSETQPKEMQKAMYLEDLLRRQIEKLRRYDLDGSLKLAEESDSVSRELVQNNVLGRPEFAQQREKISSLYREIQLVISSMRNEVSGKLDQIRTGIATLSKYVEK